MKPDPRLLALIAVALVGVLIGVVFYLMSPEEVYTPSREENPAGEQTYSPTSNSPKSTACLSA